LYYSYSDSQGSLIALVHDGGNVIQRFTYDPWGARRDPNNWTVKDSRTSFIINRGYTGHEHLDVFGIINMNGRVYDPLTAMFFSPDSYVQAPGNWLNYNRYGYCSGNPFSYTDPSGDLQIGPFYLSLNIGLSPQGGLTFGISAGIGIENIFSVGVGINYGFKTGNLSATINAAAFGGYITGGYDTQAGWMVGAGFAAPSSFSVWSPVSFSTNILSVGVSYSENGGWSGNYSALNISSAGMSFDPSIGASLTVESYRDEYKTGQISTQEYKQLLKNAQDYNSDEYVDDYDNTLKSKIKNTFNGFEEGDAGVALITTKTNDYGMDNCGNYVNSKGEVIGGYSSKSLFGKSEIHISSNTRTSNDINFKAITGHEIIHAVHRSMIFNFTKGISEKVAYEYTANIYKNAGQTANAFLTRNTFLSNFPFVYNSTVPSSYSLSLNKYITY